MINKFHNINHKKKLSLKYSLIYGFHFKRMNSYVHLYDRLEVVDNTGKKSKLLHA